MLPGVKIKLREFGLAEIGLATPFAFAFSVTGMEILVDPELTLMKPTSTPEVGAPAPIETVRVRGVLPAWGVTTSQLVSECAVTETVAVPVEDVSNTDCAGVAVPVSVLNVSCCGLATSVVV